MRDGRRCKQLLQQVLVLCIDQTVVEHTQALVRPQARQRLPPSEPTWRSHQNALRINNAALGVALLNTGWEMLT